MELLVQRIFDSLGNGAIYASMAVAFTLVFRSSGFLNFAQGEMAMFSTYLVLLLSSPPSSFLRGSSISSIVPGTPLPVWAALVVTIPVSMLLGALVERVLIRPVGERDGAAVVSVTFGFLLLLHVIAVSTWSGFGRTIPSLFPTEIGDWVTVGTARLRYDTIGTWMLLGGVLGSVYLYLRFTRSGLAFRSIASNRESAELCGIRVGAQLMIGWAIAAGIGSIAGTVVASTSRLSPNLMGGILVFSLAGATLGGLDSPAGAAVGGLVMAVTQTMLSGYIDFVTGDIGVVVASAVLLVVLIFRPQGLFGRTRSARA